MVEEWDQQVTQRWLKVACDFCATFDAGQKFDPIRRRIKKCSFCEKDVCHDCAAFHRENNDDWVMACPDCEPVAKAVEPDVRRSLGRYERFAEAMKRAVAEARGTKEEEE